MRVCAPLDASYELNSASCVPPCGLFVGSVPEVTIVHAPVVPETCAVAHPVPSKPSEKSVVLVLQLAVKLIPVTFAPLTDTDWLAGENVQPLLLGVTVYVPLARPLIVQLFDASDVAPCEPAVTLAPEVPTLPEIEYVAAGI